MPRRYKRKTSRAATYTQEDLNIAIQKVSNGELTNYAASVIYRIPKSTLNDRVLKKTGLISQTMGRPPAIPFAMEARLAQCLRVLEKWGWGLSRHEVLNITAEFIKQNNIKTPFKDNRPGADWFLAFKKRNNLSIKKPQPVEYLRKRMTDPFVIHEYFLLLKQTLDDLNLHDPNLIWNLDETSVALDPTKTKVVGGVGSPCTRTTAGTGKENITVLTTVNAAGSKLDPLIIYKGKHVYEQWLAEDKEEYIFQIAYAASKRGWIDSEIFLNYMKKVVIPGLREKRPVLIIYDGHSTHVNPEVVSLAVENQITILKLPAHTSHLLQPLDLAVFKSFKSIWDRRLTEWQRQNVGKKLRKQIFAEMFAETWHLTSPKVIRNGFKKGGIYPFNNAVVPVEKYDPLAYRRWLASQNINVKVKSLKQLCLEKYNNTIIKDKKIKDSTCTTFEELLLSQLTQQSYNSNGKDNTMKLKRVAKGAEVITRKMLEKNKENLLKDTSEKELGQTKSKIKNKGIGKKTTTKPMNIQLNRDLEPKNEASKSKFKNKPDSYKSKDQKINTICTTFENLETVKKTNKKSKRDQSLATSTTSESLDMSLHSDSDIIDSQSDFLSYYMDSIDETNVLIQKSKQNETCKDIMVNEKYTNFPDDTVNEVLREKQNCVITTNELVENTPSTTLGNTSRNKVTILSSVRFKPENKRFVGMKMYESLHLKEIDKSYDVSNTRKRKYMEQEKEDLLTRQRKSKEKEVFEEVKKDKHYSIGDTVLVRYYTTCWKYYVGVIENIDLKNIIYTIHYYKTIGKKENVKFTVPRRKDYDSVPENSIVKKTELLQIGGKEYVLLNAEDAVYF